MPARPPLLPGEQVLIDIRPHSAFLSAPLLAAVVAVALGITLDVAIPHTSVTIHWVEGAVVAVPCVWLAARFVRWRRCWLMLTSDRLVDQWGAASGNQIDIPLDSIERVTAVQSPLRRLVGTGAIDVAVWGQGVLHRVEDARKPAVLVRIITRRLGPPPEVWPEDHWG
ncbi:MAG TPA: PH domain-containing protein [Acidimicrobiales bacterium]